MEVAVVSSPNERGEAPAEREKKGNVVIFLDSLDGCITLLDSLSQILRKGWLELASARHSMGPSPISSALFYLKVQSAVTTTHVSETIRGSQPEGVQETYSAHAGDSSTAAVDANMIQRERSKSVAVFGTLVSPSLRSAQDSFESALETFVEIANLRSSILSAYSQLQKE